MASRLELQAQLEALLESRNVYFQPPPSVQMVYPAIIYELSDIESDHADNNPYSHRTRYQITVIDRDPDSTIHKKVGALSTARFDRFYPAENLNHFVYNLFF